MANGEGSSIRIVAGPDPCREVWPRFVSESGPTLWLTRTQLRRRELEREAGQGRPVEFARRFFTLNEWARSVYDRLPGRRPLIGRAEQVRLIQRLLEEEEKTDRESPFREARRRPGLADRVRQLFANLKQELPLETTRGAAIEIKAAVRAADGLMRRMIGGGAGAGSEGLAARLRDPVLRLFQGYLREMEELGLGDDEDVFLAVEAALGAGHLPEPEVAPSPLDEARQQERAARPYAKLVVEGWYLLNDVQRRLMKELSRRADETFVLMEGLFPELPDASKEAEGLLPGDRVYAGELKFWRGLGAEVMLAGEAPRIFMGGEEWPRRRDLLRSFAGGEAGAPEAAALVGPEGEDADPPITLWRHPRPDEEIRAIARRIVALFRRSDDAGAQPPRVAVVFPSLDRAGDLVEEVFSRHGLCYRVVNPLKVSRTAPARMLTDLFALVRLGFPRAETIAFLVSPLLRLDLRDAEDEPVTRGDLLTLDLLLREARFHGGRGEEHWRRRLERWVERAEARLEQVRARREERPASGAEEAGDLDPEQRDLDEEIARLERGLVCARRAGAAVVERLEAWEELGARRDPLALAEGWIEEYRRLGLLEGLRPRLEDLRRIPPEVVERDLRAWEMVAGAMSEVGRVLALDPEARVDQQLFEADVRQALEAEEFTLTEADDPSAVQVLSRLDVRLLNFDELFVAGLRSEDVPGRQRMNIFFSETERARVGWRTHADTVSEWLHALTLALAGSRRVHLSWSGDSEGGQPSLFLEDLARAAGRSLEDVLKQAEAYGARAPISTRDRCLAWRAEWNRAPQKPETVQPRVRDRQARDLESEGPIRPIARASLPRLRTTPHGLALRLAANELRATVGTGSIYDGRLDFAGEAARALDALAWSAGHLSATALETYATCPFKAWGGRLIRLSALPELAAVPEQREVGTAVHAALARLFADIAEESRRENPPEEELPAFWAGRLEGAGPHLAELLREEAESLSDEEDLFWKGQIGRWCAGLEADGSSGADRDEPPATLEELSAGDGSLADLLRLQCEVLSGLVPMAFEAGLGSRRGRAVLEPTPVEVPLPSAPDAARRSIAVRGILDRIDLWPGADGRPPGLVLFDYKTGTLPRKRDIDAGLLFQLPLYLTALRRVYPERSLEAALYIGLKGGSASFGGLFSEEFLAEFGEGLGLVPSGNRKPTADQTPVEMETYLEYSLGRAVQALEASASGTFATGWLGAADMGCGFCDFQRVCRVNHDAKHRWSYSADEVEASRWRIYLPAED